MLYRAVLTVLLVALLGACGLQNSQQSVDDARAAVSVFHADLNAENYESIWREASDDLHNSTSREQFDQFLAAVHRKMGKTQTTEQVGWNVNATTGGTFVTLSMKTRFAAGQGDETFIFVKRGDQLQLQGYNVNSPVLIIN